MLAWTQWDSCLTGLRGPPGYPYRPMPSTADLDHHPNSSRWHNTLTSTPPTEPTALRVVLRNGSVGKAKKAQGSFSISISGYLLAKMKELSNAVEDQGEKSIQCSRILPTRELRMLVSLQHKGSAS